MKEHTYSAEIHVEKASSLNYSKALGKIKSYKRSSVSIKETSRILTVSIEAHDATALRASVNAIMRDVQVIESAVKIP